MKQTQLDKETQYQKGNSGAMAIEAVFIVPIVSLVVIVLIYAAMFSFQKSLMNLQAHKIATEVARIITYSGYESIYNEAESKGLIRNNAVDFSGEYAISKSTLNEIYKEHNPYRQWSLLSKKKVERLNLNESPGEALVETMKAVSVIAIGIPQEPKITIDPGLFVTLVTVEASFIYEYPGFFNIIGLGERVEVMSTSVTVNATDPIEFIRNVDIAEDLTNFLLEKLGVKDKLDSFMKKTKDFIDKWAG